MARSNLEGALIKNVVFGAPAAGSTAGVSGMMRVPVLAVTPLGTNQATAAPLASGANIVTGANGTLAVRLPPAQAGMVCHIKNVTAAVLPVFPASGDAINAIAANSALSFAASTSAVLVAADTTTWYSFPLLPS